MLSRQDLPSSPGPRGKRGKRRSAGRTEAETPRLTSKQRPRGEDAPAPAPGDDDDDEFASLLPEEVRDAAMRRAYSDLFDQLGGEVLDLGDLDD